MSAIISPPPLDDQARDWLQAVLGTQPDYRAAVSSAGLQRWLHHYLAFYQLPDPRTYAGVAHVMFRLPGGLVGQAWVPENCRGTLFFVHGYLDHVGLTGHIIRFALEQGRAFVSFDLPGHGLSQGTRAAIDDFAIYTDGLSQLITCARGYFPASSYLVGQSTGGAIIADWLFRRRRDQHHTNVQPMAGIGLLAPLARPWHWGWYGWALPVLSLLVKETRRQFKANSHNEDFVKRQRSDPLQSHVIPWVWLKAMVQWQRKLKLQPPSEQPLLLVQGTQDKTIDAACTLREYSRCFPRLSIYEVEDANHHLINESPIYREQVFGALKNHFDW